MSSKSLAVVAALACSASALADPITLGFYDFRGVADGFNGSAVASQLSVEVSDGGSTTSFKFKNAGPLSSSIADIYFDDGAYFSPLAAATHFTATGVAFTSLASPGNLPGAEDAVPDFVTSNNLSADADAPVASNGINASEELVVTLSNLAGIDFADVIAGLTDGSIRIGIHVQQLGANQDKSDSFINTPVPEPAELALCLVAVAGVVLGYRRMRVSRAASVA